MKHQIGLRIFAPVTAGVLGLMAWVYHAAGPDRAADLRLQASAPKQTATAGSPMVPGSASRIGASTKGSSRADQKSNVVRLMTDQVLATVNKEPIQLRNLMPVESNKAVEQKMTPEEYGSRLQRAIDMAVVMQAAHAEGVELSEAQQKRLENIASGNEAELAHYKKYGLSWSSVGEPHIEFERQLLAAQMLEQNLVARKSNVAPSPDAAVQSQYEKARIELLKQLHSRASIAVAEREAP